MGRVVDCLAGLVALARLVVEGRDAWRGWRGDGPPTGGGGGGDREGPDQPQPPDAGA